MFRDRALRVVLVLVGLMFLYGVTALTQWNDPGKACHRRRRMRRAGQYRGHAWVFARCRDGFRL